MDPSNLLRDPYILGTHEYYLEWTWEKKGFVEDEVGVAGWYMLMVGFCTTNGDDHRKPGTAVLVQEIVVGSWVLIQEFKVSSLVETTEGCASVCANYMRDCVYLWIFEQTGTQKMRVCSIPLVLSCLLSL